MKVICKLGCKPIGIEAGEIVEATQNKQFENLVDLHKNGKCVPEMKMFVELVEEKNETKNGCKQMSLFDFL